MLAKVVARMKGGVSSRMGRTSEGMVTMWCVDEGDQAVEGGAEAVEELIGCGMVLTEFEEDGLRILAGLELFGDLDEVLLILVHVGPADFEELVEGDVDHLVVEEFFGEGVGADAEVAC